MESGREAAVHARGTWHCPDAKARDRNPENPQLRFIWVPSAAFHTATGAAPAVVATARVSKALGAVFGVADRPRLSALSISSLRQHGRV